jgi:hypothetical protein
MEANAKGLQKLLVEDHPDWKVPERRVNKFLKRHINNHKNPSAADDDETAVIDLKESPPKNRTRKFGRPFTRLFSKRNAVETPEAAPECAPPEAAPEAAPEEPEKKEAEVAEPEPVAVESRGLENMYEDDNTGSEKDKCECNACVIL